MKTLTRVSADDLMALQTSDRVALVLMGGGAKGAYEVGVWKALWKLGIRKFCTISGTSVGALNAFVFASGDPASADKVWDDVIAAGVLQTGRSRVAGIGAVVLAHFLIFLSIVLELLLLVAEAAGLLVVVIARSRGTPANHDGALYFGSAGLLLMFCWLTARIDVGFLRWLATGGYALPLFARRPERTARFVNRIGFLGVGLSIVGMLASGRPSHHLPGWLMWLLPVSWALLVVLRHQGLWLLHEAVRIRPLFERKSLDAAIAELTRENKLFSNCTGPVTATLARHAAYDDPFQVHPLERRYRYDGIAGEYVRRVDYSGSWRDGEPRLAEWVPEYVDLRSAPDAAWVLGASSAIPFAFRALTRKQRDDIGRDVTEVFVDGGLADNLPILPALEAKPEYMIVVGLNASDTLVDEEILQRTVQDNWRKSFFSRRKNDDAADRMREEWINSLPADYFALREELSRVLARSADSSLGKLFPLPMSPGPFPRLPKIGPQLGDVRVIFLRPSGATSIDLPILGLVTGTMRFDPAYKEKLVTIGFNDTEAIFKAAVAGQPPDGETRDTA